MSTAEAGIAAAQTCYVRWFHLATILAIILPSFAPAQTNTGAEIVREMNRARQPPAEYVIFLEKVRTQFSGNLLILPNGVRLHTHEGVAAVNEAIRFLRTTKSRSPLAFSEGMSLGAAEHVADQRNGAFGHTGSDGSNPGKRMNRHGAWSGCWGENVSYGGSNAREIVIALIVDDGQRARKHRKNIFNPDFHFAGAAIGPHARFGTACSIDFASNYLEAPGATSDLVARN